MGIEESKRADLVLVNTKLFSCNLLEQIRSKHGFSDLSECFERVVWRIAKSDLESWQINQAWDSSLTEIDEGLDPKHE